MDADWITNAAHVCDQHFLACTATSNGFLMQIYREVEFSWGLPGRGWVMWFGSWREAPKTWEWECT